jgi:trehalose synthase
MRCQLHPLAIHERPLADYAQVVGEHEVERLRELARPLAGTRVLHLTAAAPRGRTAELLYALLPILRDAGVKPEWRVAFGNRAFRIAARSLHDGMQGAEAGIEDSAWDAYAQALESAAAGLEGEWDAVVLHDPQPLAAVAGIDSGPVAWRCHLDSSEPDTAAWERLAPFAERCAARVFAMDSFAPPGAQADHAIPPAIDPLAPAAAELPVRLAGRIARSNGLDLSRPFVSQVARLDPWKDPHSVIDAFTLAKEELPDLQLALAGAPAPDDAEGWRVFKEISDYATGLPDVHVVTGYTGTGSVELSALRRLARAVVHRSLREGFGLAASEALWQGTPVVAEAAGGIPLQVRDGEEGFLTEDVDDTAARVVELVRDPGLAIELGQRGRERVREHFLVTRLLGDELELLAALTGERRLIANPRTPG